MKYYVEVEISEVRAISHNIDGNSQADMFARITIGNHPPHTTDRKADDDHVYPHWKWGFYFPESSFANRIPIQLQLLDRDSNGNQILDINPSANARSMNLRFEFDPIAANSVGDVAGHLFLTDGTEVSGSELRRKDDIGTLHNVKFWETNTIHLRGAGDSRRAELWYKVRVVEEFID